jgi:hypothetical protein
MRATFWLVSNFLASFSPLIRKVILIYLRSWVFQRNEDIKQYHQTCYTFSCNWFCVPEFQRCLVPRLIVWRDDPRVIFFGSLCLWGTAYPSYSLAPCTRVKLVLRAFARIFGIKISDVKFRLCRHRELEVIKRSGSIWKCPPLSSRELDKACILTRPLASGL